MTDTQRQMVYRFLIAAAIYFIFGNYTARAAPTQLFLESLVFATGYVAFTFLLRAIFRRRRD